jgi:uncharacterized repeat protein (TIGR03803 family)
MFMRGSRPERACAWRIMPRRSDARLGPLLTALVVALVVRGGSAPAASLADAPGVAVTNIHSFHTGDGVSPRAGLMLAPDGQLYGTTWRGGTGGGTTYRIDPTTHVFQVLHVFSLLDANGRNTDGYGPVAPLSIGPDGLIYGTTREGGQAGPLPTSRGAGVLFRFNPANQTQFTVLHHFATAAGDQDGATPSGAVVPDGRGNYYGATNIGVIYKWDGAAIMPVHVFEPLKPDRTNFGGGSISRAAVSSLPRYAGRRPAASRTSACPRPRDSGLPSHRAADIGPSAAARAQPSGSRSSISNRASGAAGAERRDEPSFR